MVQNGPERAERDQIGIDAPDGPCGALIGVALIWFAAGMLVALALTVVIIT